MSKTYSINTQEFDSYYSSVRRKWYLTFGISLVFLAAFELLIYKLVGDVEPIILSLLLIILVFGISLKYWSKQLQPFRAAKYTVSDDTIVLVLPNSEQYELRIDEIGDINERKIGTLIIKRRSGLIRALFGNRSWMPFKHMNKIFIPSVVPEYQDLISSLKAGANNR